MFNSVLICDYWPTRMTMSPLGSVFLDNKHLSSPNYIPFWKCSAKEQHRVKGDKGLTLSVSSNKSWIRLVRSPVWQTAFVTFVSLTIQLRVYHAPNWRDEEIPPSGHATWQTVSLRSIKTSEFLGGVVGPAAWLPYSISRPQCMISPYTWFQTSQISTDTCLIQYSHLSYPGMAFDCVNIWERQICDVMGKT